MRVRVSGVITRSAMPSAFRAEHEMAKVDRAFFLLPVRVASFPGTFLTAGRGAREVLAADGGEGDDA